MIAISDLTRQIAMVLGLGLAVTAASQAQTVTGVTGGGVVGATLPAGFPEILDDSFLKPVIGFGAAGTVRRTPVIFLHGNNDTPFATACSTSNYMQAMAQYFANNGYSPSELWGLGYQGDQCDLISTIPPPGGIGVTSGSFGTGTVSPGGDATLRSSAAHTNAANVPDLRKFVKAVRAYTRSYKVDIVAFGSGVTLAREWVRQDDAEKLVRRFVAIEGPNRGMVLCSADTQNPWQSPFKGAYPGSPVCQELGSPSTLFLKRLNSTFNKIDPADTLAVRNTDQSCLFTLTDGQACSWTAMTTPPVDSLGVPTDFSTSASLRGAKELGLSGQAGYDVYGGSAHMGIAYSPSTQRAAFKFLTTSR